MSAERGARGLDLPWLTMLAAVFLAPMTIGGLGQGRWLLYDPYVTPKLIVLALAALVGSVGLVLRLAHGGSLQWNRLYALALAFLVIAAISAVYGVAKPSALLGSPDRQGLMALIVCVSLGFTAMQAVRSPKRARDLQVALVAGSVPIALLALLQVTGLDPIDWGSGVAHWMLARGVSTLGNPDQLGGYLVLPLVLAPALAVSEPDSLKRFLAWACFGLIAVSWLATLTRAAWVGGAVGLLLLVLAGAKGRVRLRRLDLVALGMSAAGLIAMAVRAAPQAAPRLAAMFSAEGLIASGRLEIWRAGILAVPDRWLLGYGPDSYRYAFMRHARASFSSTYADDAHNYPLMIAVTLGVPALLVALSLLVGVIRESAGIALAKHEDPRRFTMGGWLAAMLAHLVYLLFGPSSIATTALLWVCLGVLCSVRARPLELSCKRLPMALTSSLAAMSLVAVVLAGSIAVGSYHIKRSYEPPLTQTLVEAEKAKAVMPWLPENRLRVAELLGIRAMSAVAEGSLQASVAVQRAINEYEALLAFAPLEYEATVMYANVLNGVVPLEGDSAAERALRVSQSAKHLFPEGLSAVVAEATALNSLGRSAEVVGLLESKWDEDADYVEPGIQYGYALWQVGDRAGAHDVVQRLEKLHPADGRVSSLRSYLAALEGSAGTESVGRD